MVTHNANDQKAKEEILEAKASYDSKDHINTIKSNNANLLYSDTLVYSHSTEDITYLLRYRLMT